MQPGLAGKGIAYPEDLKGEVDEPRRGRFGIILQGREAGPRNLAEIAFTRIDQPIESYARPSVTVAIDLATGREIWL